MKYLYTSCFGSFGFDENLNLIDKIIFNDILNVNKKLKINEWLEEEKKLIKKYGPIFFVGIKKDKLENVTLTQDSDKLKRITDFFKNNINQFYNNNLIITKNDIKSSVGKDLLIVQTINNVDELNKTINLNVKRLREWYSLYNPEFSNRINDNEKFVELIINNKDTKEKDSMGAEFEKKDLLPIKNLAEEISKLYELKKFQEKYLEELMRAECPNITAIAGSLIGAKLIELAGSLKRMAELPASTIQLLGAEKALFRHLRNKKALAPKYGVLHEHPLIARAAKKDHGRIARTLSDKLAIAARIDYFKGEFIGDKLREELEEKFKSTTTT